MKNKTSFAISEEIRHKIRQSKTKQNELLEIDVTMSDEVDFPSIKAMEFIVGIGEFIESVPSLFDEDVDDDNRLFRFFYTIPLGNRKHFEDLIYNRFFNDDEISYLSITFMPEELQSYTIPTEPQQAAQGNQIMHIEFSKLDKSNKLLAELNVCTSRFQDLHQKLKDLPRTSELISFQKEFNAASQSLTELATSLHKNSITMQMLPLHTLTGKYRRIIYDYCRNSGKQIQLAVNNANIQLDKKIIDKLDEPMIHLIRNAMDHGIESAQEREKNRKPPQGTITINAINRGEKAIIEITDDGRGIDPEKVRAACLQKALYPDEKIAEMTEDELYQCLFIPGFSTARKVTDISGRGVGLDVVHTAIKEMNGKITVESGIGRGTTIKIVLPETLSLIKTLLLRCENELFAVPSKSIAKIVTPYETKKGKKHKRPAINYNGKKIYLYPLKDLFTHKAYLDDEESVKADNETIYMIVKTGNDFVALEADCIVDMRDVVVKPFGSYLGTIPGYAGAIICWDGSIIYLIDTSSIESRIEDYERG